MEESVQEGKRMWMLNDDKPIKVLITKVGRCPYGYKLIHREGMDAGPYGGLEFQSGDAESFADDWRDLYARQIQDHKDSIERLEAMRADVETWNLDLTTGTVR